MEAGGRAWRDDAALGSAAQPTPTPLLPTSPSPQHEEAELRRLFQNAHFARVRSRFVAPVLCVRGKYVCRSATLAHEVEVRVHTLSPDECS